MLVGREAEQRRLAAVLDTARAGRSEVLAVVGEAGVGKSALLDDTASRADGMTVLRARGVQSETHVPFAGLFELLRPALGRIDRLAQPQAVALESALALRPAQAHDRFAVGAATLGLLAVLAEDRPLLVLVDDAHWLDGSSAAALLFAVRRALADALAVVLAVREGEPSLLDGADLPCLNLRGLHPPAAAELVRRHAAEPVPEATLDRLQRETGGNPLALLELAAERPALDAPLEAPSPVVTSVARVYLRRCQALPESARDLLLLAAAGESSDLLVQTTAARRLGLDLTDLAPAEAAGLVQVGDDRVTFRHPLVRLAVYADATPDRRRRTHRALAEALPDVDADRRAWHLALAALGPDDAASAALEQAGDRARARSAYDVASRAFERAAHLAPEESRRAQLSYEAADAAWLCGRATRAVELLEAVRARASPPELAASIEHLHGHIATRRGPVSHGRAVLLAAAERTASFDADRAVVMLAEALNAAFYAGDAPAMRHVAERIAAIAPAGTSRRTAFFATMAQGMAEIFSGSGERGCELVRRAVGLLGRSDELAGDPRLLAWVVMGPLWLREARVGAALVDRAVDLARQQLAVGVLPFLLGHVALEQTATDRWAEAEATFSEAIVLARETAQRTDLTSALSRLAWLEARQGKEDACRDHAAEALSLSRELGLGLCEIWAHAALTDLELGLGRPERALQHAQRHQAALDRLDVRDVDLSPVPETVDALLRLRQHERARPLVDRFVADAAAKGQPWATARALRCRGLLVEEAGLDDVFGEALDLHERAGDGFETARTQLAYGERLRRAGTRVRAREQLRAAAETFDRLGARPWADLVRAELAASGETARRREPSTAHDLTPQELQIALMLAQGRTTREAAAAVFLSPKTIEYHLRSVYRKLGVSSRAALAAALGTAAPTPVPGSG
jgi:DNA-binding CsgD family transcriptional regulator